MRHAPIDSDTVPDYRPVTSLGFWQAYVIHMRPYLLFVSGVAGTSGMAIAGNVADSPVRFGLAFAAFFLSYGFGQALTDCFQTDTDRLSASYRPLSQEVVSPKSVAIVSIVALVGTGVILIGLNVWNLPLVILSIAGLATYSFVKRHFWIAGPFYNAWIVMILPLMGYLSVSHDSLPSLASKVYILGPLLLLTFFSYANFVLMGYLKDVSADRKTGYKTFPVRWGYTATVTFGDVFVVASIVFCALSIGDNIVGLAFLVLGSLIALVGQGFAHVTADRSERNTAFPIAATVRSFLLWHFAIIASYLASGWVFCLGFYVAFELALSRRPDRAQI